MYEVQHKTEIDGWVNTWTTYHPLEGEHPMYFATKDKALRELEDFFEALKDSVDRGHMPEDHGYRPEDFRIVEVEVAA